MEGLNGLLSRLDVLVQDRRRLETRLVRGLQAKGLDLSHRLENLSHVGFGHLRRDKVHKEIVLELALHRLSNRRQSLLVQLVVLLVDESVHHQVHARLYFFAVHIAASLHSVLRVLKVDVSDSGPLATLVNLDVALEDLTEPAEHLLQLVLASLLVETLDEKIRKSHNLLLGGITLFLALVEIDFNLLAEEVFLIHLRGCLLSLLGKRVLNVGKTTARAIGIGNEFCGHDLAVLRESLENLLLGDLFGNVANDDVCERVSILVLTRAAEDEGLALVDGVVLIAVAALQFLLVVEVDVAEAAVLHRV